MDSTSLLSQISVLMSSSENNDQIEVPSVAPNLFMPDGMSIEYPAGVRILITRPEWGRPLHDITLYYPAEGGDLHFYCSMSSDTYDEVSLYFRSKGSQATALRVDFMDQHRQFPASMLASTSSTAAPLRLLSVKGDGARELVRFLSSLPFPGIVNLSILDQDKEEPVLRLFTTGTVTPKSDPRHAQFPQPQSNPLAVMATFCGQPKGAG
ncbi:hypothetical protein [Acidisphaera sp. L21]|uniref:hypothetical protein n=1 Tax=Acidisphaera sp. L21 TaxID=1641851 RepID=UPI001C204C63|nr:hypothetical protein [Acidisphaera sp. L21]